MHEMWTIPPVFKQVSLILIFVCMLAVSENVYSQKRVIRGYIVSHDKGAGVVGWWRCGATGLLILTGSNCKILLFETEYMAELENSLDKLEHLDMLAGEKLAGAIDLEKKYSSSAIGGFQRARIYKLIIQSTRSVMSSVKAEAGSVDSENIFQIIRCCQSLLDLQDG
jgi:hypothetical protein